MVFVHYRLSQLLKESDEATLKVSLADDKQISFEEEQSFILVL